MAHAGDIEIRSTHGVVKVTTVTTAPVGYGNTYALQHPDPLGERCGFPGCKVPHHKRAT